MSSESFFGSTALGNGPIRTGRAAGARDDISAGYLFADTLKEPFGSFTALEFFESILFVSDATLEIRSPLG